MAASKAIPLDVPAMYGGRPLFDRPFRFMAPTLPRLDDVISLYRRSYENGQVTNDVLVSAFESAVCERLDVQHCVAVSSCTAGLMLVLRCLDLTGEVIIPAFTFFATGHAALWNDLRPVFADCDPETWNISPADVERKITPQTSAIMPVHLYGNPCDVEALTRIATSRHLKLIFDAAHAFGSLHQGRAIGGFGDAEVFSLSPTKTLVAGEGGLITTNDTTLASRLRAARNYGNAGDYDCGVLGLNARLSEFHAGLGLAGLDLVDGKVRRNNEIARQYTQMLAGVPGIRFQTIACDDMSTHKDYSVHIDAETFGLSRDDTAAALMAENIETRRYFYPPLNRQQLYRKFGNGKTNQVPETDCLSDGILSLPIYPSLDDQTVCTVARAIHRLSAAAAP
jgi:dTDP-4-amino-4,6-dideoxygalactose transaminase